MRLPTDDGLILRSHVRNKLTDQDYIAYRYFLGKEGESMIPNIVALIHLNSGTVKTGVRFKTIIGGETK